MAKKNLNLNPPYCSICEKNFEGELEKLHYCICDKAVCTNCINSVKKNEEVWVCAHCQAENNINKSRLFRENK